MPIPANDDWANAITLTGASGSTTGDNTDATTQAGEPIPSEGPGDGPWQSIWWVWTAPSSGNFYFSTEGSRLADTTGMDTVLGIYRGSSLAGLIEVAANDDGDGFAGDNGLNSRANIVAQSGVTYFIQVSGYNATNFGSIALSWATFTFPSPPSITSPTSGQTIIVEGEGADGLTMTWTPANDRWEASITRGFSGPFDGTVRSVSGTTETSTNFGFQLPYVSQTLYLWVRRYLNANGAWSTWTSIPINVVVRVDPLQGCFEQEALVDTPTGLWMPGTLRDRVIVDQSGNNYDMVENWGVEQPFDHTGFSNDFRIEVFDDFNHGFSNNYFPYPGQVIVVCLMAIAYRINVFAPPVRPSPPTISGPFIPGGTPAGILTGTWTKHGSNTFNHDKGSASYAAAGRMEVWSYICSGTEVPGYYWNWQAADSDYPGDFSSPGTADVIGHADWYLVDAVDPGSGGIPRGPSEAAMALMYGKKIKVDQVLMTYADRTSVNYPSFTPPAERYMTLNHPMQTEETSFVLVDDPGIAGQDVEYVQTGTAFPFNNPAAHIFGRRYDWHYANEAAPTRGFSYAGTSGAGLGLFLVVFTGMDADYDVPVSDEPFCTSCGVSSTGTMQSTRKRWQDADIFDSSGSITQLFGADTSGRHSFTVELVARTGTADSGFVSVQACSIELDRNSSNGIDAFPNFGFATQEVDCWHHYVWTYDDSTTIGRYYVDGEPTFTETGVVNPSNQGNVMSVSTGSKVGAVAVYDHVLTRTRINAHFNQLCFLCAENVWTVRTKAIPASTRFLNYDARLDRLRQP